MEIDALTKERAELFMQVEQLSVFMKDPHLKEYMRVGVAKSSGVLNASGQMAMDIVQCTLEEARNLFQERLDENAQEIQKAMRRVQI